MRYRLYPDPRQEPHLQEYCNQARFIYNLALAQRNMYRPGRGPTPFYLEQCKQLTEIRAEFDWVRSASAVVQQQALKDLDQNYRHFFMGIAGRPKFRKRGTHEGFRIVGPDARRVRSDNAKWSSVAVPKIGWVRFRRTRDLPVDYKSYRVTCDRSGRWFISFSWIPPQIAAPGNGLTVGVDRGVKIAAALSTGLASTPKKLRASESERLLRIQRSISRGEKHSTRRERKRLRAAKIHARKADRCKDWAEKLSTQLARDFDTIKIEDLKIGSMVRSAKGSREKPGKAVRAKSGLNRAIQESGWGLLAQRLEDKVGERLIRVVPAYTSQTCSNCKHTAKESRKSQAVFQCGACGWAENADINAACNIRDSTKIRAKKSSSAARPAVPGRGDIVLQGESTKRQPTVSAKR